MIVAVSGVLRVPVPVFLVLVALAKTGRYIALGWLGAAAFGGIDADPISARLTPENVKIPLTKNGKS
jgi:hypothetical protein